MPHKHPALHNAMWPGLVGKGPDSEPPIDLETMLDLTAATEVDGVKFDGVDLFLSDPHVSIDSNADDLKRLADGVARRGLVVGSLVAPVWPPTGGGSAMGDDDERKKFLTQVRKACAIGRSSAISASGSTASSASTRPRARPTGRRIRRATPGGSPRPSARPRHRRGLRRAARRRRRDLLGRDAQLETDRRTAGSGGPPENGRLAGRHGAHAAVHSWATTRRKIASCPTDYDWSDPAVLDDALRTMTRALRPWTIDFHVAQNDATVKGSGSHDKTGRHCLPLDPNGKLDIVKHAGFWLRDDSGAADACRSSTSAGTAACSRMRS